MTKLFLLTTAAIAAVATPAVARDAKPAETTTESSSPVTATAKPARETRYCIEDSVTGSRIRQKTCQTRAEWMREGFDPLAK